MAALARLYIGIKGKVLALDATTGTEIWRTDVKGSDFVNVTFVEGRLYASARGEMFAIDAATGRILWNNPLKGLGTGLVTVAGSSQAPAVAMEQRRREAAAAAAAAASA